MVNQGPDCKPHEVLSAPCKCDFVIRYVLEQIKDK